MGLTVGVNHRVNPSAIWSVNAGMSLGISLGFKMGVIPKVIVGLN
jgi:hypothetical protein